MTLGLKEGRWGEGCRSSDLSLQNPQPTPKSGLNATLPTSLSSTSYSASTSSNNTTLYWERTLTACDLQL